MLLLHLGAGKDAWLVKEAMQKAIAILPSQLVKDHNLGPRSRYGPPSGVHLRGRRPGLLLRSSQPLAAGIPTRTPTDWSASTCGKEPTCRSTTPRTWVAFASSLNNRPRKALRNS